MTDRIDVSARVARLRQPARPPGTPLTGDRFLAAAEEHMAHFREALIYKSVRRDYDEKLEKVDAGYGRWLDGLLTWLKSEYDVGDAPILDFGCGTGLLTVLMNSLGHTAIGLDLHERHLSMGRLLARENGMDGDAMFVASRSRTLPFEDGAFGIITLFSVVEHLDDDVMSWLLPELARISRGVVFTLFPNRWKPLDDHTQLRFVCWMPRALAVPYIRARGPKYAYHISDDGTWDVVSRGFYAASRKFREAGFTVGFPPDEHVFPSLEQVPPLRGFGKHTRNGLIGIPYPVRTLQRMGVPRQAFYPYLNLVFESPNARRRKPAGG
ncbi:MAG TPA: class I SAM-dependent methyltransferase [Longimicrobiales bacterium]